MADCKLFAVLAIFCALSLKANADAGKCGPNEFKCVHGDKCVRRTQWCDGRNDCRDRSDEYFCDGKKTCMRGYFKCGEGRCIPETALCDSYRDCPDGLDEKNCNLPGGPGGQFNEDSDAPSRPTQVSRLPQLLGNERNIQELYDEYASIKKGHRRPWTVAQLPANRNKNRYYEDDLLPFDHSRVILDRLPGDPNSDFINANYITGQTSDREYVATQGPLPNTVADFWRMIWQLNSTKIIMLANLLEHGKVKVHKYWPESTETHGDIEVTKISEYPFLDLQHVVRTFSVKKAGVAYPRIVRHFHFIGWPDLGVPEDRLQIISLVNQARLFDSSNKAPIVVHCSAGIGRTGTVIFMDSMLQKGKAEGVVDYPKRLDSMRTQRPDVVETKEQYLLAHKAVNEVLNDPVMAQRMLEVEERYKAMDQELDPEQFSEPKDVHEALQKMRLQNIAMKYLIEGVIESLDNE